MKGNKKILVIAALLLLISVSFTTYAIYRTSFSGTGTVKAAAWSVKLKKGATEVQNLNFDYSDITWTTLTGYNNTIAPGSQGTITFTVDASGSEVDVLVGATVDQTNLPTGFTVTNVSDPATISYASGEGNMTATVTLTVAWAGTDEDTTEKDESDLAKKGQNITIPVTVTAKQSLVNHAS